MDGVPGLTQDAGAPGDSFTYRFPLRDEGTLWYHAHNNAWEQVARGLYGALIVYEDGKSVLRVTSLYLLMTVGLTRKIKSTPPVLAACTIGTTEGGMKIS